MIDPHAEYYYNIIFSIFLGIAIPLLINYVNEQPKQTTVTMQ